MLKRGKKNGRPSEADATFQFGFDFDDTAELAVVDEPRAGSAFPEPVPDTVPPLIPDAPAAGSARSAAPPAPPAPAPPAPPAPAAAVRAADVEVAQPEAAPVPQPEAVVQRVAGPADALVVAARTDAERDRKDAAQRAPRQRRSVAQRLGLTGKDGGATAHAPRTDLVGAEPETTGTTDGPAVTEKAAARRPLAERLGLRHKPAAAATDMTAPDSGKDPSERKPRRTLDERLGMGKKPAPAAPGAGPASPDSGKDPSERKPRRTLDERLGMGKKPAPAAADPVLPDSGKDAAERKPRRTLDERLGLGKKPAAAGPDADEAGAERAPRRSLAQRLGLGTKTHFAAETDAPPVPEFVDFPGSRTDHEPDTDTEGAPPARRKLALPRLSRHTDAPKTPEKPKAPAGLAQRLGRTAKGERPAGAPKVDRPSGDGALALLGLARKGQQRPAKPAKAAKAEKSSSPLLAALGLGVKKRADAATGRIIRLDQPDPEAAAAAAKLITANADRPKRKLKDVVRRAPNADAAPKTPKAKKAKRSGYDGPRVLGMHPSVAPGVLATALSFGVLLVLAPRALSLAGQTMPLPAGALAALALLISAAVAIAGFVRSQADLPATERLNLDRIRARVGALTRRKHDDVPVGMPAAFLGSDMDEQRSVFERLLNNVVPGKDIVGLDIGSGALRAAIVRDGVTFAVATRPIEPGIIVDGLLADPAGLSRELRALWKQAGFSSTQVNFSVANRAVALRTLTLAAATDPRDLELAVAVNAETVLAPMKTADSIIDYAELSRTGSRVALQLAAAEETMVRQYVAAVQAAGLSAVSCELGPLAEGRALIVPRKQGVAHGVVNIGAEKTTFICASGSDIFFLRVVDIGGNDFTAAVQTALNCSWEDAEQLKRRSGLSVEPVDHALAHDTFITCQAAMQYVADRLAQELSGTPRLFEELQEGRPVSGMTLTGGGARLAGLADQIAMFVNVPALTAPEARPGLEMDDTALYATALGLALGHRMSLLPDIKGRSFALEIPGRRRKPKVSADRTKKQAKRLKAGAGTQSTVSPSTIGGLAGVIAIGAMYMWGTSIKTSNDELATKLQTAQAAQQQAAQQVVAPTYTGAGADLVTRVAAELVRNPDHEVGAGIASLADVHKVGDPQLLQAVQGYTFTGKLADQPRTALVEALKALPGVKSADAAPNGPDTFTVTVKAPADTNLKP